MNIGIVVSRFNEEVTSRLLKSCVKTLVSRGVPDSSIKVVEVPGAYEIPWAAQEMALAGRFQVVIALGAILKGATPQNGHIARSTISHLHDISLKTRVPIVLGVITPDNWNQAMKRTRGDHDRGKEAALAALEMGTLHKRLKKDLSASKRKR